MPISIGVAGPYPLNELQSSFRTASRALETAVALGMPGIYDIASLGLFPAVIADPTVGDALQARYVTPLAERGEAGDTILDTVESYLDLRCPLGDTASALYVHPNTVRYRLGRFESLTDCSLQDTRVLAEVWWALQRRRLSLPGAGDRGPDRTAI
jgi:DNA-binding PucR family transcriptional regulator